jgi:hypothetical protein
MRLRRRPNTLGHLAGIRTIASSRRSHCSRCHLGCPSVDRLGSSHRLQEWHWRILHDCRLVGYVGVVRALYGLGTTTMSHFALSRWGSIAWALILTLLVPFLSQRVTFLMLCKEESKNTGCGRCARRIGNECEGIADGSYQPAEVRSILWRIRENRRVLHKSPQIDKLFVVLRIHDIMRCNGRLSLFRGITAEQFGLRWKVPLPYVIWIVGEIESVGQQTVSYLARRILNRLERWCCPNISPQRSQTPFVETSRRIFIELLVKRHGKNRGAFVIDQCFLRHPRLSVRYLNQYDCKDGDHQRSNGCDRRVFTINEMSSASPIDSERDTEAGDFLLMGGIVCLLLAAYTLLKRF